jgi:hypothetical protein
MREKNPCLPSAWPSAEAIFLWPGQGVNMNLLRENKGLTEAFKKTIRKILKMLATLSLGLIYALVTLAIPTFSCQCPFNSIFG